MSFLEYAPAPESRAILSLRDRYGLFIDGEFVDGRGTPFQTISPATEEHIADDRERERGRRRRRRRRRPPRLRPHLVAHERPRPRQVPVPHRAPRAGARPRARRRRVASTTASRSRRARDVDVPLVAAWFFYYAGWADKLDHAGLGANPRSLGVAAQVIPWNFPLLMLAWKIAPALAAGNTVVLKPAETTPLTRAASSPRSCSRPTCRPASSTSSRARATRARRSSRHDDVDKVAFTGSTAVGRAIAKQIAGTDKKVTLELGGKAANIVFDDAPIDQAIEGIVNGIFFNQGHVCCAGSPPARAGEHPRRGRRAAEAAPVDAAPRRPARQEHRHRRDQLEGAARAHPRALRRRRGRGRRALERAVRDPRERVLVRADDLHQRADVEPHRPRGDLRPGAVGAHVPHAGRGDRQGEQHPLRPLRRHLDRQGQPHPRGRRPAARRRDLGEHLQPLRPVEPVRRLQGVGLRPRGRPSRPRRVPLARAHRPGGALAPATRAAVESADAAAAPKARRAVRASARTAKAATKGSKR